MQYVLRFITELENERIAIRVWRDDHTGDFLVGRFTSADVFGLTWTDQLGVETEAREAWVLGWHDPERRAKAEATVRKLMEGVIANR